MGKPGIKDPTVGTSSRVLRLLFSERSVGLAGACVGASLGLRLLKDTPVDRRLVGLVSGALGGAIGGYGAGYGTMTAIQWLRWQGIKWLLAYRGWMFKPKARSTTVSEDVSFHILP